MAKNIFGFEDDNNDPKRNQKKRIRSYKKNPRTQNKPEFQYDQIPKATNPTEIQNLLRAGYKGPVNVTLNRFVVDSLLENNHRNRYCSQASVDCLIKSYIKTGYEPVGMMSMYTDGLLADGQHRLKALQLFYARGNRFKTPPVQEFRFGITEDRGMDIDNGRPRSANDALRIKGVIENPTYSSAVRSYILREEMFQGESNSHRKVIASEIEEVWNAGFCGVRALGVFSGIPSPTGRKKATAWLVLAFKLIQDEWGTVKAKEAKDQFYNGTNSRDYRVALRNYIVSLKNVHYDAGSIEGEALLETIFYCFNRFLKKKMASKEPIIAGKTEPLAKNPNKEFNE